MYQIFVCQRTNKYFIFLSEEIIFKPHINIKIMI